MATDKEKLLALFLDQIAGDLADDLDWCLQQFDALNQHLPKSQEWAERYLKAKAHLSTRRAYETACAS